MAGGGGRNSPAIGIDLGTTYSCAAVWQNNRAEVIPNGSGNRTTPSVVSFFQSDILVGDDAQVNAHRNASNTIYEIKRLMGRRFRDEHVRKDMVVWHFRVVEAAGGRPKVAVQIQGEERQYTPEEISSMILSKIRQFAESFLATTVDRAVVTVPAYFTDLQRRATRDAALIAGFDVLRIINEPTAAAVAYGLDNMPAGGVKRILIFDLGGGTLDVTVALLHDGVLEVKATAGDCHLGGEDFDYRMVRFLAEEFRRKHDLDISGNPKALRRLKNECERAKRLLSFQPSTTVFVDSLMDGTDMEMKISRAKFEELNMDLFEKCLPLVERCLRDAGIEKEAVDEVVLVGGSTRIPKIREMLKELLNKDSMCPNQSTVNPDEAVALGAAILAAKHAGEGDEPPHELVLVDVTPLSLGIETHGGVMTVLIPRNTPIPVMKELVFSTAVDEQTKVEIKVFEGERSMTRGNNLLGVFVLAGIEPAPGRVPHIVVSFLVDENGILRVTAEDKGRGHREGIVVWNEHGRAWAEEIERMVDEAEAHRREDEARRKEVEARNRLESFVCSVRRKMGSGKLGKLSGDDEELVEAALSTVSALLEDKEQLSGAEEVESVRLELETLWTEFLAHLYQ